MYRSYSDRFAATVAGFSDNTAGSRARQRGWVTAEALGCIVAGLMVLVLPERAVDLLAVLLGLGLLFVGGWLCATAFGSQARGQRWQIAVPAAIAFAGGVCVLAYPVFGAVALVTAAAVWLLVTGIRDLVLAWTRSHHRVINALVGAVSVLTALSMIVRPVGILTDGVLVLLVGTGLIVRGILQLIHASRRSHRRRLRRHHSEADQSATTIGESHVRDELQPHR